MVRLPLTSDPCRAFATTVGDARYVVTTKWNDRAGVWTMDIADGDTDELLVSGMPVVLGSDLLRSFCPRLGVMIAVDAETDPGEGSEAGAEDFGSRVEVVWMTREEAEAEIDA